MTAADRPGQVPGINGGRVTDLEALAAGLSGHLEASRRPGVTAWMAFDASLLKVIEETGELAGAHSRYRGTSRRLGTIADVEGELADVVLSAAVYAIQAGAGQGLRAWHRGPRPAPPGTLTADTADTALITLARAVYRLTAAHPSLPAPPAHTTQHDLTRLTAESLTAARTYAAHSGIDLDQAITRKVTQIHARGWREEEQPPPVTARTNATAGTTG